MSDNKKLLLGFAAGVAAGVGIYAFSQTRQGKEMVKKAKRKLRSMQTQMEDLAEKGKEAMDNLKGKYADNAG
ncbi:MAG TPA: YtxH domain-containing protein [Phnomibacter sp.]|nr:YtxH domain-containing protein [Phnomibacter sp.]